MSKKLSVVELAKKRFKLAQEAYSKLRELSQADTRFALADSDNMWAWPDDVKTDRASSKRVCLTINLAAQHCAQIVNNIRSNKPTVKVSPVGNGARKKTAEILSGLIRNIHNVNNAEECHVTAAECAIIGGEGYWRVTTEYESPTSFDQEVKILSCPDPSSVYIDPMCKTPDKSDAEWGFVFEDISLEQCEREYPDIKCRDWEAGRKADGWCSDDTVRIAEYYYCEYTKDVACLLEDGSTVLKSELPANIKPIKERPTHVKKWKWCKLVGGHDDPVEKTDLLGDYLPIISVIGREMMVGGELVRKGLVRDLKDQGRMVNYAYSETTQSIALQSKAPYIAAKEAIDGYEDVWDRANLDTVSYLPYNARDNNGEALPAPAKQPPTSIPTAQIQLLQLSVEQMRAASGQQNANFGIKSEAESGIGIRRLQVQGETATFHFPDNLARAKAYEAKVIIDLIQKYYDTKRIVRIIGEDGKEEHATLHPQAESPYQEVQTDGDIQRIFNPTLGKYDVVISTGPNYQTQRQEAAANLTELAGRNPKVMDVAGDLVFKSQDFPGADALAARWEKTLPPGLVDNQGKADPNQAQAQMQQAQQQMQQMDNAIKQLMQENAQLKDGSQEKQAQASIDAQTELQKAQLQSHVALQKAQLESDTKKQIAQMQIDAAAEIAMMHERMNLHQHAMDNHPMLQSDPEQPGLAQDEPPNSQEG